MQWETVVLHPLVDTISQKALINLYYWIFLMSIFVNIFVVFCCVSHETLV